jgi:hypothetical protein
VHNVQTSVLPCGSEAERKANPVDIATVTMATAMALSRWRVLPLRYEELCGQAGGMHVARCDSYDSPDWIME